MDHFELVSEYQPTGDQPQAIAELVKGFREGNQFETLLGVTGSGKTFTMANVIQQLQKPTLVIAHNKTLAAQLYGEFKEMFPDNAVEYFVSYYDYYQPEAYIAHTDTYIEKDSSVNEEIDRLRHSATSALFERRDVIVVASVSCLYGLGDPIDYKSMVVSLRVGQEHPLDQILKKLTEIRYERNDLDFSRNKFRVRGDTLEVYPAYWSGRAIRIEFFGDEVDRISEINAVSGLTERYVDHVAIYPASHYVASKEKLQRAMLEIQRECDQQVQFFRDNNKLIEAQRIAQRTAYDLEMLTEIGFCSGIENYSRVIQGRAPGTPPTTLLDYFPKDYLMFIDESHVTLPQCRAMYAGDRSRKDALVNYGFRPPPASDHPPPPPPPPPRRIGFRRTVRRPDGGGCAVHARFYEYPDAVGLFRCGIYGRRYQSRSGAIAGRFAQLVERSVADLYHRCGRYRRGAGYGRADTGYHGRYGHYRHVASEVCGHQVFHGYLPGGLRGDPFRLGGDRFRSRYGR
mgnify:CR=1 FL=1